MSQHIVTLAGETDSVGFRHEARALLSALVAPDDVTWKTAPPAIVDLYVRTGPRPARAGHAHGATNLLLPRSFLSLCETVILHQASMRFGLLYRLLWRLVHEPELHRTPLDADRVRALHMAQAVRRDMQKMKTQLQFRRIGEEADPEALHLAWFEPDHHIVEAVAPFFARRFAQLHWAILTSGRSVRWDGEMLEFAPGSRLGAAPASELSEALDARWLGGYRKVFAAAPTDAGWLRSDTDNALARSSLPDSAP